MKLLFRILVLILVGIVLRALPAIPHESDAFSPDGTWTKVDVPEIATPRE